MVSIIMPVRNGQPYLEACLDSILPQTYENWELVVVNDNSTDDTCEVLSKYASTDDRIRLLNNNGNGILDALHLGYQNSSGEFITRMDADDRMSMNKLELMVNALSNGELSIGLVEYFSENEVGNGYRKYAEWLNELTNSQNNFADIYKECSIPSACWMTRRKDFERCGGFGNRYPEDYDLAFRFYRSKLKLSPVDSVLHYWRDHDARASRNDPNYADNRFLAIKLDYFLEIDKADSALVLVGAGKKGKELASMLLEKNVPFKWATNNSKKIGVNIYDQILISDQGIQDEDQLIIAVAGQEGQELRSKFSKGFFFC
ncbi:MAG: glycosyltransferase involved in cell wall biosynthesis [Parvicellaceae bacterium]|jgi:glycosyltransferase involved in cell wall biosynthesis